MGKIKIIITKQDYEVVKEDEGKKDLSKWDIMTQNMEKLIDTLNIDSNEFSSETTYKKLCKYKI